MSDATKRLLAAVERVESVLPNGRLLFRFMCISKFIFISMHSLVYHSVIFH